MGDLQALEQKIKGKLQKVKGSLQQEVSPRDDLGAKIKGGVSKMKGSINDTIGDIKLRSHKPRSAHRYKKDPVI